MPCPSNTEYNSTRKQFPVNLDTDFKAGPFDSSIDVCTNPEDQHIYGQNYYAPEIFGNQLSTVSVMGKVLYANCTKERGQGNTKHFKLFTLYLLINWSQVSI